MGRGPAAPAPGEADAQKPAALRSPPHGQLPLQPPLAALRLTAARRRQMWQRRGTRELVREQGEVKTRKK